MISIFNYTSFHTYLNKKTRSLYVSFKPGHSEYLTLETLFELESLFSWLTNRMEIHSVLINAENGEFFTGPEGEFLSELSREKLLKYYDKIAYLTYAMRHLPQTIVVDLGKKVANIGIELSLGADIRLAHQDIEMHFNHLTMGLVPASGMFAQLAQLVGHARSKAWILGSKSIRAQEILHAGLIDQLHAEDRTNLKSYSFLLQRIADQAPVCRIQSKLALLEIERSSLEKGMECSKNIGQAASVNEDWKTTDYPDEEFMPAKNMGEVIKLARKQPSDSQSHF